MEIEKPFYLAEKLLWKTPVAVEDKETSVSQFIRSGELIADDKQCLVWLLVIQSWIASRKVLNIKFSFRSRDLLKNYVGLQNGSHSGVAIPSSNLFSISYRVFL